MNTATPRKAPSRNWEPFAPTRKKDGDLVLTSRGFVPVRQEGDRR